VTSEPHKGPVMLQKGGPVESNDRFKGDVISRKGGEKRYRKEKGFAESAAGKRVFTLSEAKKGEKGDLHFYFRRSSKGRIHCHILEGRRTEKIKQTMRDGDHMV